MKKIFFLVLLMSASYASADCYLDGVSYPTGTVVSGLTCQNDGSWR